MIVEEIGAFSIHSEDLNSCRELVSIIQKDLVSNKISLYALIEDDGSGAMWAFDEDPDRIDLFGTDYADTPAARYGIAVGENEMGYFERFDRPWLKA